MSTTSRAFILPDTHFAVLEEEAIRMGISLDKAIANAIALYQLVNNKSRSGLQMAFLDADGNPERVFPKTSPPFD